VSEFDGKVALVTGAGRGAGRAIARAFAARGASVAANDITPVNLDETVAQILADGGLARDYVFDVAKKMPVQSMVEQVIADWGRIDVLVNNARVEPSAPLLEMDDWGWHRTLDVNLSGAFYTMQAVGVHMRERGAGAIVNVASAAGGAPWLEERCACAASKMGLIGLTRAAARELAVYNIRVNAVCPGFTETTLSAPDEGLAAPQDHQPQEIAEVVVFLCSQAATHITGQVINADREQVIC
jgi:3-oxoacyl-[acyl-carrier protein] reductase/2-hydroxycyclohexanecarboxyl-CoA dehydrogenase